MLTYAGNHSHNPGDNAWWEQLGQCLNSTAPSPSDHRGGVLSPELTNTVTLADGEYNLCLTHLNVTREHSHVTMGVHTSPPSSPPTAPAPSAPMICQVLSRLDYGDGERRKHILSRILLPVRPTRRLWAEPSRCSRTCQNRLCQPVPRLLVHGAALFTESNNKQPLLLFKQRRVLRRRICTSSRRRGPDSKPNNWIFGNGRGFRAFSLRDNLYPITIRLRNTGFRRSDINVISSVGRDQQLRSPPSRVQLRSRLRRLWPTSGKWCTVDQWASIERGVGGVPTHGIRTKRGSPYDLDFVRELRLERTEATLLTCRFL